jgi:hypothetical protein
VRAVLAIAAALAAVVAAVVLAPAGDIAWVDSGADGWARGPFAEARITSVRQTQAVQSGYSRLETSQVFVLVGLEVTARRQLAPLGDISLLTSDGHEYRQRGELGAAELLSVEPGFTGSGTAMFEVPPERLPGARLLIVPHQGGLLYYRSGLRIGLEVGELQPEASAPAAQTWVQP